MENRSKPRKRRLLEADNASELHSAGSTFDIFQKHSFPQSQHKTRDVSSRRSPKVHVSPLPSGIKTGELTFAKAVGYEIKRHPYMKVDNDVNMNSLAYVLTEEWEIKCPRIVLVVISDLKPLNGWKKQRQLGNFLKGLIKAAYTTEMWICTHGKNIGIAQAIGNALEKEALHRQTLICENHLRHKQCNPTQITLLGICSEERLIHADVLSSAVEVKEGILELTNRGNQDQCVPPDKKKYDMNSYHSHFIIVNNKSQRWYGISDFLSHFVQYLVESTPETSDSSREMNYLGATEIPVLAILIQGNPKCVRFIKNHLEKKLPLIVIKGSGGIADLLAFSYYEIYRRPQGINDLEYLEHVLKPGLSVKISHNFPDLRHRNASRKSVCDSIIECVRYSKHQDQEFLTILNIHDQNCKLENIAVHMLKALFKSQKIDVTNWSSQMEKDLYLTIDWNCPDVCMTEVFRKDSSRKFQIENKVFETVLLKTDREEFVPMFLEFGFLVRLYLSGPRLLELFRKSLSEEFFRTVCWEGALGYGPVTDITLEFIDSDLNWLLEELTGIPSFLSTQELEVNSSDFFTPNQIDEKMAAERKARTALVVWAVLSNRVKLSKLLWTCSQEPINLALISSMIFRKLQPFVHEIGQKLEMEKQSKEFAEMATGVLDACFKEVTCRAFDVLYEENPDFAYKTAVDIAAVAKNKTFLAHPCCQKWLTNMFRGNIRIRDLTWGVLTFPEWVKVLLSAFFVFPMYFWVQFKTSPHENEDSDFTGADEAPVEQNGGQKSEDVDNKTIESFKSEENNPLSDIYEVLQKRTKYNYPPLNQMIYFMWSAPITKFWVFQVFYMLYLAVFSLAVLWPSCGNKTLDMIVCIWTTLIVMESIHRTYILYKKNSSVPLFLKCVEIFFILLFICLYVMGRLVGYGMFFDPYNGKILLCCGLLYFYYRVIFIYLPISSTLGPLLYRVKLMVLVDFVNWMRMVLLVMISNAIIMQAVIYPDYPIIPELFRRAFHKAWISLFLTPVSDFGETSPHCVRWIRRPLNATFCKVGRYMDYSCPNPGLWPYIFGIQYMMLLKLILLTLLFALFSNTQNMLSAASDEIWKFQRHQLIVDFAHRLRLPAPLNIFSYTFMIVHFCCKLIPFLFKKKKESEKQNDVITKSHLSSRDYSYWQQLAHAYSARQEAKRQEKEHSSKQWDMILSIAEDMNYQRKMIQKLKSQITELKIDVTYTQTYMETIKYRYVQGEDFKGKKTHQILSRRSPYPETEIQRFPVPDKYVAWEIMWLNYDPVAFTRTRSEFFLSLQCYVDVDVLSLQQEQVEDANRPVFKWNMACVSPAGVYLNRESWMLDANGEKLIYKLDDDNLPQNPMGRTGLRGKGILLRWGPNHYIYVIITRWKSGNTSHRLMEIVLMSVVKKDHLSLPGGFVTCENRYDEIQKLFTTDQLKGAWKDSEDMIEFFRSCISPESTSSSTTGEHSSETATENFKFQKIFTGYLDEPQNTDHSWMEIEVWHIHYDQPDDIEHKFKGKLKWVLITEDIFKILPLGQCTLLQDIIHSMKADIFV